MRVRSVAAFIVGVTVAALIVGTYAWPEGHNAPARLFRRAFTRSSM
jgi:hypothetical protein